ncbi:TraR/DksA family transcriptional regulator [Nannocystis punicea]|uniref:TraR/DksA family transcriptional regulator n=1 Tax=Nannocystis punicea TaxID=2995304 RepID=A0ABY7H5F3_9BACT|nr:TraR/DksA family transcriptional regulator [Nannocystis poenicansa]WAS94310.1 TraR/DksA family transcriptional regulator [Nannocystis poenicansa]
MDHLTKDQLARLKQRLEDERSSLLRREVEHRAETTAPPSPDVGDQQDLAANEAAQVAQLSIADHERSRLREVEDALGRMQTGTYGICEDTEEEIPFERLWAQPTARLTVEAQEIREREARERAELRDAY